MHKNKNNNNANFLEIRVFTNGVKENVIQLPKGAIKGLEKVTLKDKANGKLFYVSKEFADILNNKL
jgi:hypothetical protein